MREIADDIIVAYESMAAADVLVSHSIAAGTPATVCLDPLRIKQVIANGVTNALKNTVTGSVTLRVRASVAWLECGQQDNVTWHGLGRLKRWRSPTLVLGCCFKSWTLVLG